MNDANELNGILKFMARFELGFGPSNDIYRTNRIFYKYLRQSKFEYDFEIHPPERDQHAYATKAAKVLSEDFGDFGDWLKQKYNRKQNTRGLGRLYRPQSKAFVQI